MSWEVSTMPSKKSCFNRTLFRKNLSRFWPLWGIVSLVGAMFPLYLLIALLQRPGDVSITHPDLFIGSLYQIAAYFVPGFTCAYTILCAMAVWGYLYNARSVGMMHTLPVDRTCLFVTNTLSGLAMVLIPYAVTGGLLCLIALCWGFFDLVAVMNTVLMVLFCALLFFGMAALCAMLTGNVFVLPAFYLLANFLAIFMELLTTSLADEFLLGVGTVQDEGHIGFLSPVVQLYGSVQPRIEYSSERDAIISARLEGLWVAALYALVGCAMLALAWFLYKRRHSESAGDVVAFRWLRPVFRYGLALLSALTVGRLLFELFWASLFQRTYYADRLPMGVCLFLGGLVGYYAASMLLEKSLRVFRGSWKGALIVAAGAAAVCLLVSVDVFGLERRVPEADEVESVVLTDRGIESGPFQDPALVEKVLQFHRAIVADRDYIRSYNPNWDYEEGRVFSHTILLNYRLKDGSSLTRYYSLWLTEDRVKTAGTYDNLLAAFYQDPQVRLDSVSIPAGTELNEIAVVGNYIKDYSVSTAGNSQEAKRIYAAVQQDAMEGGIPALDVLRYREDMYYYYDRQFRLELEYLIYHDREGAYYGHSRTVYLIPSMTHTLDTLVELGYLTEEDRAAWEQEWAEWQAESDVPEPEEVIFAA